MHTRFAAGYLSFHMQAKDGRAVLNNRVRVAHRIKVKSSLLKVSGL